MSRLADFLARWKDSPLSFNPWPFFISFLFANTVLSHTSWSLQIKIFIIVFFIFLPALIAGWILHEEKSPLTSLPELPDPPIFLYWILGGLLLFTQFYHLETNPFWPTMDDSREDYYSLHNLSHWDWRLLSGENQIQPLYIWLLSSLLRVFSPSLLFYSTVPAVIFVLSIIIVYWSLTRLFPKGPSLYLAAFLAFSFPTYALSRFHQRHVLMFLLECLLLGVLCVYFQKPEQKSPRIALGLVVAAGFYTYHSWAVIGLWVFCLLLLDALFRRRFAAFSQTCLIALAASLPMLWTRLQPSGIEYYQSRFDFGSFGVPFLTGFFWKSHGTVPYGPNWGGWYNPVAGALIFLGVLWLYRIRKQPWIFPILLGMLLFSIPALITSDPQMYRLMTMLPFIALGAVGGVSCLAQTLAPTRRWFLAIGLLAVCSGLDAYHYFAHYLPVSNLPQDKRPWRTQAYHDAYQLMNKTFQMNGPGLVFHSFTTDYPNRSLEVYTFSFNALQNHRLDPTQAKWAAVVCDPNLLPFLKKRFSAGRWTLLGDESSRYTFGTLPTDSFEGPELRRWIDTHAAIVELDRAALYKTPAQSWDILGPPLREIQGRMGNDPFLKTIYADLASMFYNIQRDLPSATDSLLFGLREGYPSAKLLNDLGYLLFLAGHQQAALRCFERACSSEINLTSAEHNLAVLKTATSSVGGR